MILRRAAVAATCALLLLVSLPSCTATARVIDVYTALDAQGDRRRQIFYTNTNELHCVVEAAASRPGVTLELLLRQVQAYDFANGKFFDSDRVQGRAEFAMGRGQGREFLSAQLVEIGPDGQANDDLPHEPGRWICEVYLEGRLEDTATFNILFPDCPGTQIVNGDRCLGFYENGRECGRYGLTSTDAAKCTCRAAAGWECL